MVKQHATVAGFTPREQHLQPHYVRTLDTWAANLEATRTRPSRSPMTRFTNGSTGT